MMNELQTTVVFSDKYTLRDFKAGKLCFENMLVRQVVSFDPITAIPSVEVYTDDGAGNGKLLYKFDLA